MEDKMQVAKTELDGSKPLRQASDIMKLARYRSQYEGRDKYGFDVIAKSDFNKLNSTYQNKAFEEYDRTYGKPKEGENYDYKIRTEMGRSWQKIFESRQ